MAAADVAAAMAVAVVVAVVVAMWLVPKEEAVQAEAVAAKALEMSVAVAVAAAMSVAVAVATSMANAADVLLQARRQKCIRTTSGNRAGDRALITKQSESIRLNRTQSDAINSTVVLVIVIREHAGNQARPKTERSSLRRSQTQSDSIGLNRTQSTQRWCS